MPINDFNVRVCAPEGFSEEEIEDAIADALEGMHAVPETGTVIPERQEWIATVVFHDRYEGHCPTCGHEVPAHEDVLCILCDHKSNCDICKGVL